MESLWSYSHKNWALHEFWQIAEVKLSSQSQFYQLI